MSLRFQKTLAATLILSSVLSLVVLISYSQPQKVQAQSGGCASVVAAVIAGIAGTSAASKITGVPTADFGAEAGAASSAGSAYGTFFNDCVLKPLVIAMANRVLANITNSLVTWIQSGFNGSPAFVTNIDDLVSNSANQAIGQFINGTSVSFLCQPFSLQVRIALATSFSSQQQYQGCTLSKIDQNIEQFGNTEQAWNSWLNISTVPANNQYGAYIQASGILSDQLNAQAAKINSEVNRNGGFLDYQVCDGGYRVQTTSHASDGTAYTNFQAATASTPGAVCSHYTTQTPGSTIQTALGAKFGAEYTQIGAADDINQILGALVNEMVNKTITGAGGLLGSHTQSVSSNANLSNVVSQTQSGSSLVNTLNTQISGSASSTSADINSVVPTSIDTSGTDVAGNAASVSFSSTPVANTIFVTGLTDYKLSLAPNGTPKAPLQAIITLSNASGITPASHFDTANYSFTRMTNGQTVNIDLSKQLLTNGALTLANIVLPTTLELKIQNGTSSGGRGGTISYSLSVQILDADSNLIGQNTQNLSVIQ